MRPTTMIVRIGAVFAQLRAVARKRPVSRGSGRQDSRVPRPAVEVVSNYGVAPSFPPIR